MVLVPVVVLPAQLPFCRWGFETWLVLLVVVLLQLLTYLILIAFGAFPHLYLLGLPLVAVAVVAAAVRPLELPAAARYFVSVVVSLCSP